MDYYFHGSCVETTVENGVTHVVIGITYDGAYKNRHAPDHPMIPAEKIALYLVNTESAEIYAQKIEPSLDGGFTIPKDEFEPEQFHRQFTFDVPFDTPTMMILHAKSQESEEEWQFPYLIAQGQILNLNYPLHLLNLDGETWLDLSPLL